METEILDIESNTATSYADASKTKRFANFLIDLFVFYVLAFLVGVVMAMANVDYLLDTNPWLFNILFYLLFVGMFFVMETFMNGKTIGKYATGTRVVMEDGEPLQAKNILGRSFARLVPFEVFSFLGSESTGWHDRWSGTRVVDERKVAGR
jgi:uncharacterized RDD family membrane protein YckC